MGNQHNTGGTSIESTIQRRPNFGGSSNQDLTSTVLQNNSHQILESLSKYENSRVSSPLDNYDPLEIITNPPHYPQGSKVYRVYNKSNGSNELVIINRYKQFKSVDDEKDMRIRMEINREVKRRILEKDPSLIELLVNQNHSYEDDILNIFDVKSRCQILIKEQCKSNMYQYIEKRKQLEKPYSEEEILFILNDLTKQISKLHEIGVAIQAITPQNLFFMNNGKFKIFSLQFCSIFSTTNSKQLEKVPVNFGFLERISGEIKSNNFDPMKFDSFMIGLLGLCLASLECDIEVFSNQSKISSTLSSIKNLYPKLEPILKALVDQNSNNRPTLASTNFFGSSQNSILSLQFESNHAMTTQGYFKLNSIEQPTIANIIEKLQFLIQVGDITEASSIVKQLVEKTKGVSPDSYAQFFFELIDIAACFIYTVNIDNAFIVLEIANDFLRNNDERSNPEQFFVFYLIKLAAFYQKGNLDVVTELLEKAEKSIKLILSRTSQNTDMEFFLNIFYASKITSLYDLGNASKIIFELDEWEKFYSQSTQNDSLKKAFLNLYKADFLYKTSKLDESLALYRKNFAILNEHYGECHPDSIQCRTSIGSILLEKGDKKQGFAEIDKAFNEFVDLYGNNHRLIIFPISKLARAHYLNGSVQKSLSLYEKSISLIVNYYKKEHPAFPIFLNNIGVLYSENNQKNNALKCLEAALQKKKEAVSRMPKIKTNDILERKSTILNLNLSSSVDKSQTDITLGHDSELLMIMNNYGLVLSELGYKRKAEEILSEALKIGSAIRNIKKVDYFVSSCFCDILQNMVVLQDELGNKETALKYLDSCEGVKRAIFPTDHPEIIKIKINQAKVYADQKDYNKAEILNKECVECIRKNSNENNADLGIIYNNMGTIYSNKGEYGNAKDFYSKSLKIRQSLHGEDHIDTAISLNNLAIIESSEGNLEEAKRKYITSLDILKRIKVDDIFTPEETMIENNLGVVLYKLGDKEGALKSHVSSLEKRKRMFGDSHPDIGISLNNIGVVYSSMNEFNVAKKYFEDSLLVKEKHFRAGQEALIHTLFNYVSLLYELNKTKEIQATLEKSLEKIQNDYSAGDNEEKADALFNIAQLYHKTGDKPKAIRFCTESLDIFKRKRGEMDFKTTKCKEKLQEIQL